MMMPLISAFRQKYKKKISYPKFRLTSIKFKQKISYLYIIIVTALKHVFLENSRICSFLTTRATDFL